MSANEDDILRRIRERRALYESGDLDARIKARRRAAVEAQLFSDENLNRTDGPPPSDYRPGLGPTVDALRTVAQGAFGLGDEAEGVVRAVVPGGMGYAEGKQAAMEGVERVRRRAPVTAGLLEFGGSALSVGGAARALPVLARPILGGALMGAGYGAGAADGDIADRAVGGAIGGGLGLVTSGVIKAAGPTIRAIARPGRAAALAAGVGAARSLTDEQPGALDMATDAGKYAAGAAGTVLAGRKAAGAISRRLAARMADQGITEAVRGSGVTAQSARDMLAQAGPGRAEQVRLLDMSDDLLGMARGAMAVPGSQARTRIPAEVANRNAGRLARTTDDLVDALKVPARQSTRTARDMIAARSREADRAYEMVRALPDVDDQNVAALLDSDALKPFVRKARADWAREEAAKIGAGGMPDPVNQNSVRFIDMVKRTIDDQIGTARRQGQGNRVRVLAGLKQSLLDPVDAVRPEYRAARGAFADRSGPIDAIKMARGKLKGTRSFTRATPQDVADALGGMDDIERTMYGLGAIDDQLQALNKAGNMEGRVLGKFGPDSDEWRKLALLTGDESVVQRLAGRQSVESAFEKAANQLQPERGSRTFFGNIDAANVGSWTDIARNALEEVLPRLQSSRAVADEATDRLLLRGQDVVTYLEALEKAAQRALVNQGRVDLLSAGAGGMAAAALTPVLLDDR